MLNKRQIRLSQEKSSIRMKKGNKFRMDLEKIEEKIFFTSLDILSGNKNLDKEIDKGFGRQFSKFAEGVPFIENILLEKK